MSKSKLTKKTKVQTRKSVKAVVEATGAMESKTKAPRAELCVFAFRLTAEERDAIHRAAGSAKASKFARTLLVAAARQDETAVKAILEGIQAEA